jgi:gas vesicle protein
MTTDNTDRGAYVALGAMFGVLAGIGAGMLMAPRSGIETRNRIRERAVTAKQGAQQQLATGRDKAMDTLNKSLDKSKDMIDKGCR